MGPGTDHQLFKSYYHVFEPRLGFAWDPFKNGRTSIRGGVGMFSDRVYGNLVEDARGNPPFQPSFANEPVLTYGPAPGAQLQNQPLPPQLVPNPVVVQGANLFPDLFDPNIKPPSLVTWNFGFQRQVQRNLSLEANYVGNHGTRILRVVDGILRNRNSCRSCSLKVYLRRTWNTAICTSAKRQAFCRSMR